MSNGPEAEQNIERDDPVEDEASSEISTLPQGPARLKSVQSLERLRDTVRLAAQELERLRQENRAMREKISELETRPAVDVDGALLTLDDDPAVLREKIEGFIQAIDVYLAKDNS